VKVQKPLPNVDCPTFDENARELALYDEGYGEPNEERAGLRFLSAIQLCLLPLLDLR